ncbi:uncharacterized protein LOC105844035 [Hydra vulgaris]|uniref:Uncharacterized protein LOC105844035 n=1 Tax=Hydra vulgaris TaxID=6087 RepID=A0ABM4CC58_HYDVU
MSQIFTENVNESFTLKKIDTELKKIDTELKNHERTHTERDGQENDDSDNSNIYSESKHEKSLCFIAPSRRDVFLNLRKNTKSLFDGNLFPLEFLEKPEIFINDQFADLMELLLKLNQSFSDSNEIKFNAILLFNGTLKILCNNEIDERVKESIKNYLKSREKSQQFSIEFLSNKENAHVEMAILDHLEALGFENVKQMDIFMATFLKPCSLCYITLENIKSCMELNLFYRINDCENFVEKWNEWKNQCLDWPVPDFLKNYDSFFDNYAEYLDRKILQPYSEYESSKYEVFKSTNNVSNNNNQSQQAQQVLEACNKNIAEKIEVESFIQNCENNAKKIPYYLKKLSTSDREKLKELYQMSLHYLEEK